MAFNYEQNSVAPMQGLAAPRLNYGGGINYGNGLKSNLAYGDQQSLDYSNQFPASQQQQQMDPSQMLKLYQQYQALNGGSSAGTGNGLSGLLSTGGGTSAGLGGSGLIGSAGGATSAASSGGASFGLGGSLVGGTGTVGGSTFAAGAGSGAASGLGAGAAGGAGAIGGGAAAGGGAAGGGAAAGAAAAGPWAALAAIIMINEEDSRKKGLRSENRGQRTKDQLDGKVLTQDIEGKWGPMFDKWTGGNFSKLGFQGDAKGGSQIASGRIGPGLKSLWKEGTVGKIRKLF